MKNQYQTEEAKITKITDDTSDVKLFRLELVSGGMPEFYPGQIMEISLPGYGEAPVAYCSSASQGKYFEICVREIGLLTKRLHELKVGDTVGVRGPYGNGFPTDVIKKRNMLIVAGGIGMIPFRSLLETICDNPDDYPKDIQVFYGSRSKPELLFEKDYDKWCKKIDLHITLDEGEEGEKIKGLTCDIGLITKLFEKKKVIKDAIAIVCGPPIMCKFVVEELKKHNFANEDIYLSLERRMECGVGQCEHCAVGPYFVCKDGPVFSWDKIKDIEGVI